MTQGHSFEQHLKLGVMKQNISRSSCSRQREFSPFSVTSDSCDLLVLWLIFGFDLFFFPTLGSLLSLPITESCLPLPALPASNSSHPKAPYLYYRELMMCTGEHGCGSPNHGPGLDVFILIPGNPGYIMLHGKGEFRLLIS